MINPVKAQIEFMSPFRSDLGKNGICCIVRPSGSPLQAATIIIEEADKLFKHKDKVQTPSFLSLL